tara:strand:- start:66 stop:758 length:693 start_codon:yes stop_codon:yes gene_type:complete
MSVKDFGVITLFPEGCQAYTNASIIKRAREDGLVAINYYNPRDYTDNKHHRVDQKPYGGGPGMVLEAVPFLRAWQAAANPDKGIKKLVKLVAGKNPVYKTIFFSPSGKQFEQADAIRMANSNHNYIFICGRYEGIDQRVVEATNAEVYSVGPYILTGGELPALTMIDAITRQIPGVLGDGESLEESRIASSAVYTKPRSFKWGGKVYSVPEVLFSGNHAEIKKWRSQHKQ